MIIGLTGSFAAGKDTVAEYLVEKGFGYHSISDLLRDELRKEGKEITRENLIAMGNGTRAAYGPAEWARRMLAVIEKSGEKNSVAVSVRNPGEVRHFRENSDFQMWFVDAPAQIRYDRSAARRRSDDFASFEDFIEKERQEDTTDPNKQQLSKVATMADVTIVNDKDLSALHAQIDGLLKAIPM